MKVRAWESETIRQIENQKQIDAMNYRELQETYEHEKEKTAWIPQYYSQNFNSNLLPRKQIFSGGKSTIRKNGPQSWLVKQLTWKLVYAMNLNVDGVYYFIKQIT